MEIYIMFEPVNMAARLSMEFSQDVLYKHAVKNKYMAPLLIDRHMEELDPLQMYSSSVFEDWYCNRDNEDYLANDSTMRRWLGEFNDYIEARRDGRNWQLDYRAMFRLRMLLLYRKFNYKANTLKEILGLRAMAQLVDEEDEQQTSPDLYDENQVMKVAAMINMLIQNGRITMGEGGPTLLSLPSDLEQQINRINKELEDNHRELEQIKQDLEMQKQLNAKQQQMVNMLTEINEMMLAYQQHGDPRKLQAELGELRQKDPQLYIDTMMQLIREKRLNQFRKKRKGFWNWLWSSKRVE